MTESPGLRASDDQRERMAQEFREHFAAGRLTEEELSDRVHAVYRSQTEDELRALRADLPMLPITPAQHRAELVERRGQLQRWLLQQAGGGLAMLVICTVIWLAAGAHGQFWPAWIALVSVIPLLRNGWRLYGPAPELDRVEQELARRERHLDRRAARRVGRGRS
ncbi:MAG: DUF1707 SHOCT-like domain-containing protein [Solirubrobacteraceae bacterium]